MKLLLLFKKWWHEKWTHLNAHSFALTCETVLFCNIWGERWQHVIWWMHPVNGILHIWGMCGSILAIYHENEIAVHPRGGKEHNYELLQDSLEYLCLCCALQCEFKLSLSMCQFARYLCLIEVSKSWIVHSVLLFQVNAFPITVMFGMCSIFLFMAAILQRRLMSVAESHKALSKLTVISHMLKAKFVWRCSTIFLWSYG